MIIESGLLPDGAVQFVSGRLGPLLDRLGPQDAVSFTGSAATGVMLRGTPNLLERSVRFSAEQDSLNATILGPDVMVGDPEFDLFIRKPPARYRQGRAEMHRGAANSRSRGAAPAGGRGASGCAR